MTPSSHVDLEDRAGQMRTEFDSGFARAVRPVQDDLIDLLELRIGDLHLELPVAEVAQVVSGPVLTPLPSPAPALRGVASVGEDLVAGYDLGVLLGLARSSAAWLVTAAAQPGVGVTLDAVVRMNRVPRQLPRSLPRLALADLLGQIETIAGQSHRSER